MVNPTAFLLGLALSPTSAAVSSRYDFLSLVELQRILRSGLDDELKYIADSPRIPPSQEDATRSYHSKRRSYMRRKVEPSRRREDSYVEDPKRTRADPIIQKQLKWTHLVKHAWEIAESIKMDHNEGIVIVSNSREASPCPFLICTQQQELATENLSYEHTFRAFNKSPEESVLVSSAHNQTCAIITVAAHQVRKIASVEKHLVAIPLVDVVKIHTGTADEVSSDGWAVPYGPRTTDQENDFEPRSNETDKIRQWERVIEVDFAPGIGGMKHESILLDVVNHMMEDIQDMGENGWRLRQKRITKELGDESFDEATVNHLPTLSKVFSLTADTSSQSPKKISSRVDFWSRALENGLEAEHTCSEMFNTLYVKPKTGYYGFGLVLNPHDGPPPEDYRSSASNPSCVTSLVAALSTHPHVLSVEANFPIYYGWHVAHKMATI